MTSIIPYKVSCSSGCSQTHYAAKDDFGATISDPPASTSQGWSCRHVHQSWFKAVLEFKSRIFYMLGEHSTN